MNSGSGVTGKQALHMLTFRLYVHVMQAVVQCDRTAYEINKKNRLWINILTFFIVIVFIDLFSIIKKRLTVNNNDKQIYRQRK